MAQNTAVDTSRTGQTTYSRAEVLVFASVMAILSSLLASLLPVPNVYVAGACALIMFVGVLLCTWGIVRNSWR